jgi:hypothetical protein
MDDASAIRVMLVLHCVRIGTQVPDGLVAKVEQIGVDEWQMAVLHLAPRHRLPRTLPRRIGIVFVLHAKTSARDAVVECSDVTGGEDIRVTTAWRGIDDDAIPFAPDPFDPRPAFTSTPRSA